MCLLQLLLQSLQLCFACSPTSFPNTPPGCTTSGCWDGSVEDRQHSPPSQARMSPAVTSGEKRCFPSSSQALGWDQAKEVFEVCWQGSSFKLSQPKSSPVESETHSWGLTSLVESCSPSHVNDSFLGLLFLIHLHWNF